MTAFGDYTLLRDEIVNQVFEEGYFSGSAQMYRDFRAVFQSDYASAAQGQKVLAAICIMGGAFSAPTVYSANDKGFDGMLDTSATLVQVGRADLVNKIIRVMSFDPTGREDAPGSYDKDADDG